MNIAHSPKHSPYSDVNTHIYFSVVISQHVTIQLHGCVHGNDMHLPWLIVMYSYYKLLLSDYGFDDLLNMHSINEYFPKYIQQTLTTKLWLAISFMLSVLWQCNSYVDTRRLLTSYSSHWYNAVLETTRVATVELCKLCYWNYLNHLVPEYSLDLSGAMYMLVYMLK